MIVRLFLQWARKAPAGERAEATGALARAYLYSDLDVEEREAAQGAMIMLSDDPSPLVRRTLAEALAASADAPYAVIHALASDQHEIAAVVLERSPLFIDAELVDFVATGDREVQAAIAARAPLPRVVAAAIAEVGAAEACLIAVENAQAEFATSSIDRIIERFGHLGAIREALFARPDLPMPARQALVRLVSGLLGDFVADRAWLSADRARQVVREACEKATVAIAGLGADDTRPLIRHLRTSNQLSAGLILRALLSGNIAMFEDALAELSGLPLARVRGFVHDRGHAGFRAVFDKAGLPPSTYIAFREALTAVREAHDAGEFIGASRLKRRMVERVLTSCERTNIGDVEPLLMLLRRFAAEAAREDARAYCDQLISADFAEEPADEERVAA